MAMRRGILGGLTALLLAVSAMPATAENPRDCQNTGSFERWMDDFKREALASGINRQVVMSSLAGLKFDPRIISRDRRQGFFSQSFLDFSGRLASKNRIYNGSKKLRQLSDLFARVERDYGVPGPVITAFWALESDFGVGMGKFPVLNSLATLAYDCRRSDMFRAELMAALRIIERGDLRVDEMISSWAGELGQTQFLPAHYFKHGVDYDGDGKRDLIKSEPDIVASTAAYIRHLGWRRGEPWLEEVKLPAQMAWEQADTDIKHPRSYWAKAGVKRADGRPLPADGLPASLILMMGRNGPAFLAYHNFVIYLEWNKSLNYGVTAAYLATRLAGAPPMSKGRAQVEGFDHKDIVELQRLLVRRGFDVGGIDGTLGNLTREAVKKAQIKLGLPADSYPTRELMARLR